MKLFSKSERTKIFLAMFVALPLLSVLFLFLEHITHYEFLLHLAAIPLEILLGAFLVERYLARQEKEGKKQQLMYIKSYLFRSELRNVFISNFNALVSPKISLERIRNASLEELKEMRRGITTLEYRSPEDIEPILLDYVNAKNIFQTFMEWAITNDFEFIFHDMIFILRFIQDIQLFKKHNPDKPFIFYAEKQPQLMEKVKKVMKDGVSKFLDYAIELKEKEPDVFEELLNDYLLSAGM